MSQDRFMSDETKMKMADRLGFGDRVRQKGWGAVTTGEVGLMIREVIKAGEASLSEDASSLNENDS